MSGRLSEQDHQDLQRVADLAVEALSILRRFELRHELDMTGPALSALNRAEVSLEFAPRDARLAERYLDFDGHDIDAGGRCRKTGCRWLSDGNREHND